MNERTEKPRQVPTPQPTAFVYEGGMTGVNVLGIEFPNGVPVEVAADLVPQFERLSEFSKSTTKSTTPKESK